MSTRRAAVKTLFSCGIALLSLGMLKSENIGTLVQTPPESEGPFYPILNQKDKDFNLTHINGKSKEASGKLIWVLGQVVNTNDEPIENAKIEIWQANATGRYNHPRDPNSAAVDPYFQGWAVVASG